jgi:diguanylate cyclase (GGDEF)-like protein
VGEQPMMEPLFSRIRSKIEENYHKEDSRARFEKRTLANIFLVISLLLCVVNNLMEEYAYAFVMLLFFVVCVGCSLGFFYRKNVLVPTIAFEIACVLFIGYLLIFGIGNLSSLIWLILIPNVVTLILNYKQSLYFLFSILLAMVLLYITPLSTLLTIQFHPTFDRWMVLLIYTVFFFVSSTVELHRHIMSIKLEESRKEILRLSYFDDLTQIFNRRSFDTALNGLWNDPLNENRKTSLLMIDIDNFKLYNDNFGHLQGDKILTKIALTINSVVSNPSYTLARYGGEEFVVLMPDTNCDEATALAEKIKNTVSALGLVYYDTVDSASKILSISIGVASAELSLLDDAETLIRIADDNLYRAKRHGKNAVWSAYDNEMQS